MLTNLNNLKKYFQLLENFIIQILKINSIVPQFALVYLRLFLILYILYKLGD